MSKICTKPTSLILDNIGQIESPASRRVFVWADKMPTGIRVIFLQTPRAVSGRLVNLHPKLPQDLHRKLPHPESLIMAHI